MIYWLLLSLFLIMLILKKYSFTVGNFNNKLISGNKMYLIFSSIVLILVSGLRSEVVGKDTKMYHTLFLYAKESNSFSELFSSWTGGHMEIGYTYFEYIVSRFANFQFFLVFVGILTIIPVVILVYKYSSNYWMSLFLFVSFGYYAFSMNGIRQAMAMSICAFAYMYAKEKRLIPFIFAMILAILFHKSAVIFIPVYWLSKIKLTKYTPYIFTGLVIVSFILKNYFFAFLNMFSRLKYNYTSDVGGFRMYLFMLFTVVVLWIYRKHYLKNDENDVNLTLLYMTAIACIIWPVTSANAAVFRLYYYYHMYFILSIPELIDKVNDRYTKIALTFIFIIVGCFYLQQYVIDSDLSYAPYYFFWD